YWVLRAFEHKPRPFSQSLLPTLPLSASLEEKLDRLASYTGVDLVNGQDRDKIADSMAVLVESAVPKRFVCQAPRELAEQLKSDGIVQVPQLRLSEAQVCEV